jgi:hypothetical protein
MADVTPIIAILVCGPLRTNLDANIDTLAALNKVIVVTQESIECMPDNEAKFPLYPDAAYDEAPQLIAASKPYEAPSSRH